MQLKHKVFAYITHSQRLLVFDHVDIPEAGTQVPAGTRHEDEDPEVAVLREAAEETGLDGLRLVGFLGEIDFPRPGSDELHRRRFYHIVCEGDPPERWRHYERDPSDGTPEAILFELYWVPLPDGAPQLCPGHDAMVPALLDGMGVA